MGAARLAHGQARRPQVSSSRSQVIPLYRQDDSHPQARVCAACEVRRSALFGALDAAGLDQIHSHIASLSLAPGDTIYQRGEQGAAVYTVRSGVVRFERVTERGDRRIVRLAGPGDLIGQESVVLRVHGDDAVACTEVELCRIPCHLLSEMSAREPALLHELMSRWQRALDSAEAWVTDLTTGPARRRVLRLLLKLCDYTSAQGDIWLPAREEMGAMLDMSVETASRLISALRREGVLQTPGLRTVRVERDVLARTLAAEDA
jgi:CRP/FNR family transcriptional regulator